VSDVFRTDAKEVRWNEGQRRQWAAFQRSNARARGLSTLLNDKPPTMGVRELLHRNRRNVDAAHSLVSLGKICHVKSNTAERDKDRTRVESIFANSRRGKEGRFVRQQVWVYVREREDVIAFFPQLLPVAQIGLWWSCKPPGV
jgi:hypothetical protein